MELRTRGCPIPVVGTVAHILIGTVAVVVGLRRFTFIRWEPREWLRIRLRCILRGPIRSTSQLVLRWRASLFVVVTMAIAIAIAMVAIPGSSMMSLVRM